MTISSVLGIGSDAVTLVMLISGPLLFAALFVGLLVGVFQAVTQINEMTLTFIPKIISVFGILILLLPWMAVKLIEFTVNLYEKIPEFIR